MLRFSVAMVGAPVLITIIGVVLRSYRDLPQSALTDMLTLFIALDFTIAFDPKNFDKFLIDTSRTEDLFAMAMIALVISIVAWVFNVLEVEKKLASAHRSSRKFPFQLMLLVWSFNSMLFISHLAVLTGRVI
jgi:membrane protease YdiL (CAAX protease family)